MNIVAGFGDRLPFLYSLRVGGAAERKDKQRESALLTDQRCGKLHAISRAMSASPNFEPPNYKEQAMTTFIRLGLSVAVAAMISTGVQAADVSPLMTSPPQPKDSEPGWTVMVAPYSWMAGLSGDTAQFGLPTVHMDADFGDILDHLDFAFMAAGKPATTISASSPTSSTQNCPPMARHLSEYWRMTST